MRLTPLERRVADCAGIPTDHVAAALGCHPEAVRAARARLANDLETGLPCPRPQRRRGLDALTYEDFDVLMRGNRSVCG